MLTTLKIMCRFFLEVDAYQMQIYMHTKYILYIKKIVFRVINAHIQLSHYSMLTSNVKTNFYNNLNTDFSIYILSKKYIIHTTLTQ